MSALGHVRRAYRADALDLSDLSDAERDDPLRVVARWLAEAVARPDALEPTAMVLATAGPDARVVLCKGVDDGLVFFTNRSSAKGRQLAQDPRAAAVLHWPLLERQVRVRGEVQLLADDASDAYFASRPRGSQLGAWASDQSAPTVDRAALETQAAEVAARFADTAVPRPPGWGGHRLVPHEVELWQGRPDRLHDRLLAVRSDTTWRWQRLQP